jgi:hypothetical protein
VVSGAEPFGESKILERGEHLTDASSGHLMQRSEFRVLECLAWLCGERTEDTHCTSVRVESVTCALYAVVDIRAVRTVCIEAFAKRGGEVGPVCRAEPACRETGCGDADVCYPAEGDEHPEDVLTLLTASLTERLVEIDSDGWGGFGGV